MMRSDARSADHELEAARQQRDAAAPPPELLPDLGNMRRQLDRALLRIAEKSVPLIRAANLARVAAVRDPPSAARAQIEAAAESFKQFANG